MAGPGRSAVILLLAVLSIGTAWAGEARKQLDQFFDRLETMRGEFTQSRLDANGKTVEESEGTLFIARPDRFRLVYLKPYEQLYVADGSRIVMFDKDLEQVTIKEQGKALDKTPILLLSNPKSLDSRYRVSEPGLHSGFYWLELVPKEKESTFELIRLAFDKGVLRAMEMVDGTGQATRLFFHRIERNPKLDPGNFRFTPPPGVDVIDETR